MALNKGVGKKYIKEMFEEFDHSFGKDILPMLDLMFGAGEEISKAQMEGYTYDPNWKDSLNSGNEPIRSPKLPRASLNNASSSRTALVEKMRCNLKGKDMLAILDEAVGRPHCAACFMRPTLDWVKATPVE
ncbi:uncharacterized protein C8R40DRAFT_1073595 [Lentinula edodes]|uniref:uncharacterized protein n=1 Tax=Lentinula edodes TaxID=5353 RepID=UPI001E8D0ABE|nr:uncharacterized protein C8R40DRAFT_1073595 [Lentinula edodes]KAH7869949.1 hypothetical protein C8R40DRAFT_1073595 [Lentinula edodes]